MNIFSAPQVHSFHIPVMGTGYTIDTPIKVAHLGINSVISIMDDMLIEKMREFYCEKFNIPFQSINSSIEDFRAKRITAYLNLINQIVKDKFDKLKKSIYDTEDEIKKYMDLLPDLSELKKNFNDIITDKSLKEKIFNWIDKNITSGQIDVNIMTKVDKENYFNNLKLPAEYNDAHAALRGFAESDLESSVIFSAGMNPKLYGYIEKFNDFYPDKNGLLKKRITLKVSDFRSAMIQGKFLAKKGLWISEYRIESGLNCGGHAFATNGNLIGPILEDFKNSKKELMDSLNKILREALEEKSRELPIKPMTFIVTAQGGVGTNMEHEFLMNNYQVDSVGWGSPFLLVKDVVNIDEETSKLVANADENDLYLSNISPLGVPFNTIRGNSKDREKQQYISEGKPGSTCPKQLLIQNKEYTEKPICTASKQYQKLKINELSSKDLSPGDYASAFHRITEKTCLCLGLSETAMIKTGYKNPFEKMAVTICPGPNMAYFSKQVSLKSMLDHIYGRDSIIERNDRPNLFIKELSLYIKNFKERINELNFSSSDNDFKNLDNFRKNILDGITYYKDLFIRNFNKISGKEEDDLKQLESFENEINAISEKVIH